MKMEDCRKLQKGDKVYINLGNGWTQHMTFLRMIKVTSFGKMTFSDLMSGKFELKDGKETWEALCEYIDDRGRSKTTTFSTRKLHKDVEW